MRNFTLWDGLVRVDLQHGAVMPIVPSPGICSSWSLLHRCPEKCQWPQHKGSIRQGLVPSQPLLISLGTACAGLGAKSCISSSSSFLQKRFFVQSSLLPLPIVLAASRGWIQHPMALQPICSPAAICCCVPGVGA